MVKVLQPRTPITPWGGTQKVAWEQHKGKYNIIGEGSEHAEELSYANNQSLKLVDIVNEPGAGLPAPLREAVIRRDCFIVHSD